MYVRSEDGKRALPEPAFSVSQNLCYEDGVPDTKWYIVARSMSAITCRIAEFATEAEALARMDDVTEWLNAPEVWWKDNDGGMVTKPTVYEFGKPIGHWRQQ